MAALTDRDGAGRIPVEPTSYVGRLHEAAQARRMLGSGQLLTLSGTGGVGKTRLAGRVAAEVDRLFAGDVVFVRLAELRDAELLPDLVADALGLRDQSGRPSADVVVEHLRDRRMLLLLDNCEHLVEACARFVTAVLRECPHVSILITSRQSIGVSGEQILAVPPLEIPVADEVRSPKDLEQYDSVRLFVDRARSVVPTFEVTDDNFADVARLCQDLEGLPLAIELAAVRVRSLSVRQLTERLTDRLALLTKGRRTAPERQQTLRATIDWSHGLCSPSEQLMWARAAVFSGSFDLTAAEHVCGGAGIEPDDVLGLVDGLLDKSILVREEQSGEVRYRMLETLREYGLDRLDESADRTRVSERHRDFYAGLADRFERAWIGPDQVALMAALRREYPNIRVALDFCFTAPGQAAAGVRMIAKIVDYWSVTGLFTELRVWMDRALATLPEDAPERVTALRIDGWTALFQGDGKSVVNRFGAAGDLLTRLPDEVEAAYIAAGWGVTAVFSGDPTTAVPLTKTAWDGFRAHGIKRGESFAPTPYGLSVGLTEDYQRGRAVLEETVARCAEQGETHWRSWALCCLGFLDMKAVRDAELADAVVRQALRIAHEVGTVEVEAFTTETLAAVAAHKGHHVRAATLLGVAETGWTAMGTTPAAYVPLFELREEYAAKTRAALGDTAFERAVALGRALAPEAGLRYALDEAEPTPAAEPDSGLTKRQHQIAELIAEGLTSKEIAERLVISQRTVESHVDAIRTRLGFHTRSEIAAWVARRDR